MHQRVAYALTIPRYRKVTPTSEFHVSAGETCPGIPAQLLTRLSFGESGKAAKYKDGSLKTV